MTTGSWIITNTRAQYSGHVDKKSLVRKGPGSMAGRQTNDFSGGQIQGRQLASFQWLKTPW